VHATIGVGKLFSGLGEETERHVQDALRLSPRDTDAYLWMTIVAASKLHLGADEDAARWARRAVDANRNVPLAHFWLAAALVRLGRLDEARSAAQAGLGLNPAFSISRLRELTRSENPIFLTWRRRIYDALRQAGVPEG
jgi:tetratricopeptide (TPR) repeat protein